MHEEGWCFLDQEFGFDDVDDDWCFTATYVHKVG